MFLLLAFALSTREAVPELRASGGGHARTLTQGLTDAEIIRHVEAKDVVLTITDDDVVALLETGFSEETINELLARARDVRPSQHR